MKHESDSDLVRFLQEREKELTCIYRLEEILSRDDSTPAEVCRAAVDAIPPAWQYPDICRARVVLQGEEYKSDDFMETDWVQTCDIKIQDEVIGTISVFYTKEMPPAADGPFLKEETKLLQTIADRIAQFMLLRRIQQMAADYENGAERKPPEWRAVLEMLRRTDKDLFLNICQKMLNSLSWTGVKGAEELLRSSGLGFIALDEQVTDGENQPARKRAIRISEDVIEKVFDIADRNLPDDQILASVQKWVQEDRLRFLTRAVNRNSTLAEVSGAIRQFYRMSPEGGEIPTVTRKGIEVALIRRLLSEQLQYINIAKKFLGIDEIHEFIDRIISTTENHGRLGGKGAGLLLAEQIIRKSGRERKELSSIKVPKTWYIASDVVFQFIDFNNLGEVVEQKYKDINQVRLEYPHVIQAFKNCHFPPDVVQALSMVLDEFEGVPLIVRSSSLLEDRLGAAFSGKYRSLFIANQGTKKERLDSLTDAIAEVYASVFGPDPIEYRAERGLLDFSEEMGVMIQEVVGNRIGEYFLPAFAGVAFSSNEFRWSPRIKREDGLVRLVAGLGTRAVDRVADDYPILIAPGQPGLRVNVTTDEIIRYSPTKVDLINLETGVFETVDLKDLLDRYGSEIPAVEKMVSITDGHQIRKPLGRNIDFGKDDLVVTFEGLIGDTAFVNQMAGMLKLLEDELETPVDIEFAHDGKDFYLLQCRPQSYSEGSKPSPIPKDVPEASVVFTARKYISNGKVPDITHIVYVDPEKYGQLPERADLLSVGRAVGKLNNLLPKRQFILMGPGRWGSRGDIRLGVSVTYSDINNTAMLVEIARQKGEYTPDLSFGTHFFQDLVEARIRYLPLYPDDNDTIFNEIFLARSPNLLPELLPEFELIADTVRLIDVGAAADGRVLKVYMNADLNEAIGILAEPSTPLPVGREGEVYEERQTGDYWPWRLRMAEHIASVLDPARFGVEGMYVFGSTKNATAGPGSDIDLLIHFRGTDEQRKDLETWLDAWSLSLAQLNYLKTGYRSDGLLDVHIVTDEDIARKTSYASKIGAITDPARPLKIRKPG
ncbi:MAG: PEP/pyruvate-binding domain-containing protein [bacterium]|jgi:predicted nucleotidyltransferase